MANDDIDYRIRTALRRNGRMTNVELAEEIFTRRSRNFPVNSAFVRVSPCELSVKGRPSNSFSSLDLMELPQQCYCRYPPDDREQGRHLACQQESD